MTIDLPFPPSVNRYWRSVNGRNILSERGRRYRADVLALLAGSGRAAPPGRLHAVLELWPPDRRRRDVDNCAKGVLDAAQAAGVYADDSLIDELTVRRLGVVRGGAARLTLRPAAGWVTLRLPAGVAAEARAALEAAGRGDLAGVMGG